MVHRRNRLESGFTLIELLVVVAVIGIIAAMAVPAFQAALYKAKRNTMIANGKTLHGALTQFNLDVGEYPPCCSGLSLNQTTLEPLVSRGYLSKNSITTRLRNGRLTSYDSPDNPTPNNDFYAVMTDKRDSTLQVLVADTDEYPGFMGQNLIGVYLIRGTTLVPASQL